jgi:creatinine amidohydrolase
MPLHLPLPSHQWADLSTCDFSALQASGEIEQVVAVLPVAAIEQHGPHLPLSVDATLLAGLLQATQRQLAAELPVLFLPAQNVGLSPEHQAFPGTLTLQPETLLALWRDIGQSVARAGIKKLLIFNTHGGHVGAMDIVARDLRARCDLLVYSSSWFNLALPPALQAQFSADEQRFGIHAGEVETSMMLALQPERVDMARAENFRSSSQDRAERYRVLGDGKSAKMAWQIQDYNPAGAVGNAAAASATKGQALMDAASAQLVSLLQELVDLPLSSLKAR